MEDDKIKDLFAAFNPELRDSNTFLQDLGRRMEAVELVKRHNSSQRRCGRIAVAVAALAGFIAGGVFTAAFPLISVYLTSLMIAIPHFTISISSVLAGEVMAWLLIAAVSVLIATNAYELTLSRLLRKSCSEQTQTLH